MEIKEIEKFLIEMGIKIARSGKGALFVIKKGELKYSNLFPQDIPQFNIFKEPRRFELLAIQDGAMIIDLNGNLLSYCANIENVKTIQGFGTRHVAASTASMNNTVILVSEEEKKIRVFEKGGIVMQIDALEKGVEKRSSEIADLLESLGVGALSVMGGTALGIAGVALMPGVVVFGGIYWIIKKLLNKVPDETKQ